MKAINHKYITLDKFIDSALYDKNFGFYMKTKLIILLFISSLFSASSLAVVSKTKGNVKHKKKTQKQLNATKIGMELYNNDYIQTGDNGFAKYVYLDDGTQIKVHNNSEVYIRGEIERRSIIKLKSNIAFLSNPTKVFYLVFEMCQVILSPRH